MRLTQDAYFSLLTRAKQLLLVTFCHMTAGNGVNFRTHGWNHGRAEPQTDGQTNVEFEVVI